jgi:dihydropteroate synthase
MITVVGILNCTPDSFSDRSTDLSLHELVDQGRALINAGAHILDIGGDSTRPGSECPGVEEEWRRIEPVLRNLADKVPCSVDTHHAEIARRAISLGARLINDISGTLNEEMIEVIKASDASYIFMFNAFGAPHSFGDGLSVVNAFETIARWIRGATEKLIDAGISSERLIADPGMGAFISRDPRVSLDLLHRFAELPTPSGGVMLGCSRKGFLKLDGERDVAERDTLGARYGAMAASALQGRTPLYIRTHNAAAQLRALEDLR